MLEDALDRVALNRLRDGELIGTIDIYGEEHVHPAVLERLGELTGRNRYVPRVGTVAVDHSGDLAGAPGASRAALAELGTRLGGQTNFRHGRNSSRMDRFR